MKLLIIRFEEVKWLVPRDEEDEASGEECFQHFGTIALQVVDVLEELESRFAADLVYLQSLLANCSGQCTFIEIAIDLL